MTDYSKFDEDVIIAHKLASLYSWSWFDIFGVPLPYPKLKQLLELRSELENDENAFIDSTEVAIFKNLKRMFPAKDK